ncbi:MAG: acetylglutamate kinase [Gemmatimonadaceae bacterium]
MTRVIKVGGRPQSDPALIKALAAAHRATFPPEGATHATSEGIAVVHGGGDEVSTLQKLYGVVAEFKGGRRVTSQADIDIIRMALSGSANKRLVSALCAERVPAIGLSGEDAGIIVAEPLDFEQFGFVGVPIHVNQPLLSQLTGSFYMPVISPVSCCLDPRVGRTLNVNGDDAASAIAVALKATDLLFVSDVEGVLKDGAPISMLSPDDAQQLIDDGTAQGGMSAKLQAALKALEGGVERVRISDIAAIEQLDRGTVLTRVGSVCA